MRQALRRAGVIPALLAVLFAFGALAAPSAASQPPPIGFVEVWDANGQLVGAATLQRVQDGVQIRARFQGLPPGLHGFHVHAVGRCEAPTFMSAGDHFNPTRMQHGLLNPQGHHVGDLPNAEIAADGTANVTVVVRDATLATSDTSLFDADGSSLVVHANADDDVSDPSGNSGGRIACGVLGAGPAHDLEGLRFLDQSDEAQSLFRAVWGEYAAEAWVLERDAEVLARR